MGSFPFEGFIAADWEGAKLIAGGREQKLNWSNRMMRTLLEALFWDYFMAVWVGVKLKPCIVRFSLFSTFIFLEYKRRLGWHKLEG
jgi:hypothetical protein